jgi:hypothetical protein
LSIIELAILLDEDGGGRGSGVPVTCDTRFVPAHRLLARRLISRENRLAKLIPIDAKLDLLLKAAAGV